jgi:hypothetical protein|mmetsp:Transcript_14669/g.31607  ORF Transcript_14669/g.31607 Transcript_14669/m.31607 type:complete len:83 (-) Transcript_14669:472-720(-)
MCHSESDSESIQGRRSEADDASLSEELDSIERVTQYAAVQVVIRSVGKEEEQQSKTCGCKSPNFNTCSPNVRPYPRGRKAIK